MAKKGKMLRTVIAAAIALLPALGSMGVQTSYASETASTAIAVAPVTALQNGQRSDFLMGADVSELYELEKANKNFFDTDGLEKSCLQILKNHGVNAIRLRLWNDPTDAFGAPLGGGNNDLAHDIAIAKEAKALGMKVLLDFHYSDFWADPGKQTKPKAWANDTGATLQNDVYTFTYNALTQMQAQNAMPDMVQIGNEINNGLLWEPGTKWKSPADSAPLLQSAAKAVRDADPNKTDANRKIKIMIHLAGDSSGSVNTFTTDLNTWTSGSTAIDFDVIGISDYPYWHGTTAQNATILNTLASTYNKQVAVAETAYAWTLAAGDETINNFDQDSAYTAGYTATPQGQAAALRDVINNVAGVPNNQGLGVFYWGADWLPGDETGWKSGQGSGWENQALFDFTGHAVPSIDVFNLVRSAAAAPSSNFVSADPATVVANVYGTLTMPATVHGQYSDGYYKDTPVTSWNTSTVDLTKPGVYTAHGTIGANPTAATAIVTVQNAQPNNMVVNPGFESSQGVSYGWSSSAPSIGAPATGNTPHDGNSEIHYWSGSPFSNATVTQTVYNITPGTYTVSVWAEGDASGDTSHTPYLFATGYDSSNPSAMVTQKVTPSGWRNYAQYSLTIQVTSGQATIGVNLNGGAGAWGDVDDFYFGLPPVPPSANTFVQPVVAYGPNGAPLQDGAVIPVNKPYITLATPTPGTAIYYSTDGSDPSYSSTSNTTQIYTGPIQIAANTVLKTYATAPGYLPSTVQVSHYVPDYTGNGNVVPDGDFEQAGSLGSWTLTGATEGSGSSYVYDTVQEAAYGKIYAGNGAFNYWSSDDINFTLSRKVTGLPNGIYTLSAESAGGSNMKLDTVGRATYDPSVATLTLSASTATTQASTPVMNQGTMVSSPWWNIWKEYSISGIQVTDGTATIAFSAKAPGSAGYWGYLDHVTLVKTGELPDSGSADGSPAAGGTGTVSTTPGKALSADSSGHVDADALSGALKNASAVIVTVAGDTAYLPASALADSAKKDGSAVTVQSELGTYTLPLSVLKLDDLAKELGVNVSDLSISVAVKKVAGDTLAAIHSAAGAAGVKLLADAVDYSVQAVGKDGKTVDIRFGNTYVSRTLNMQGQVDASSATGVLYDPLTKTFRFVPATFETANGTTVATLKRNGNSIYTIASFSKNFSDIAGHWAQRDIQALANKLVIDGMTDTAFAPDSRITRAQFAALVVRALGLQEDAAAAGSFSDVKAGDWYYGTVAAAVKAGLIEGYEDGSFRPDRPITREELAALVVRALAYAGVKTDITNDVRDQLLAKYSDAKTIVWARNEIATAVQAGILNGETDTLIGPGQNATRAESAAMLRRLLAKAGFIN